MHFTDLFIRRPVLAIVVSLFILVLGLRSIGLLNVREYPYTQNAVVTVSTVYFGADPALIAGFITSPLENSIAQANGIDYISSSSLQGVSTIQATLRLNYDSVKGHDGDQHPRQRRAEPAPERRPAAGHHPDNRRAHRFDVHRLLQQGAADQQDHRLPVPGRPAEAAGRGGGAGGRDPRKAPVRHAGLARPLEDGGLRPDRHGREQRPGRKRFHLRRGPDEGADGHRGAHGRHGPSQRRGVQQPGDPTAQRGRHPAGRRGEGLPRLGRL